MIRVLLAILLNVTAVAAEPARVASGQHEGFTRLVIQLPDTADWTVGRVPLGYGFAVAGPEQPTYDTRTVWDRIPRNRLQSLRVDPVTGALHLVLACDCHVFPFEYRPGMIVLDIKDGPHPPGSSFETALSVDGTPPAPDTDLRGAAATPGGYDWLAESKAAPGVDTAPLDLPTGGVSLDPLRDELLAQISRGATEGTVDMELPGKPQRYPGTEWGELPWTTIHLGEAAGIEVIADGGEDVQSPGTECLPDEALDLAAWGEGLAAGDLLSQARTGLYGEFDRPDTTAVERAVRIHLHLGFGAEARSYADLVADAEVPDMAYYRSISRLVDGDTDPQTPFATMLGCNTAAALWAALARDRLPPGPEVDTDAILKAFLALPPHLRRSLGPALAEKLLARDDTEAARMVRDAMERTPLADPAAVALMDARAYLHAGDDAAAVVHAEAAVAEGGDDGDSLVTLVEAHLRARTPLPPDTALTLQTLLREVDAGPESAPLHRAFVLALALSGQTDAAFQEVGDEPLPELWEILPVLATDDAFLVHAILSETGAIPAVLPETRLEMSRRLIALGFADAALRWLGPMGPDEPAEERLLAAESELLRGNARAADDLLAGLTDPAALELRAKALIQLGAYDPAREVLLTTGAVEEAARVRTWQRDWATLGVDGAEPWAAAAKLVDSAPPADGTRPLGQGKTLLEDSATMRGAITALLQQVPAPQD